MARDTERVTKLPSGSYRVRYYDPSGQRKSKTFSRQADAKAFLRKVDSAMASGSYVDPKAGSIRLSEWFEIWMANRPAASVKESTKASQRATWKRCIESHALARTSLDRITPFLVNAWMSDLTTAGKRLPTVKMAHQLLSSMLGPNGGAMSDLRLQANPCTIAKCERPEDTECWRILSWAEVDRLLTYIPDEWHCLVLLMFTTGLRFGEVAGLRRGDINVLHKELTVAQGVSEVDGKTVVSTPKARRSRTISLVHERTFKLLLRQLADVTGPGNDDPVFPNSEGGYLNRRNWAKRVWTPALKDSGMGPIRRHDLRHSCASLLIEAGADPKSVQEIMGHASMATTLLYVHTTDERKRAALELAFGKVS